MRMPSLSEWSCSASSDIGTSFSVPALTRSAIFSITPPSPALRTPYGSSVMMIALLPPRSCSMCARPRTMMRPRPERYASPLEAPRPRALRAGRSSAPDDRPAGGEVGALHVLRNPLDVDARVVDHRDDPVDDLAEVVRRDVRRHADGDAGRAVDEQVRETR